MRTERVLTILFAIALTLKMFNTPGASLLLAADLLILSLVYFPFALYFFADKTLKLQNIVLSILGGMVLSMLSMGVLFKLMFWPGSTIQLAVGIILTIPLLIVTYLLSKKAAEELSVYYKRYLRRIGVCLIVSVVFYIVSDRQLLEIQHRNEPELVDLKMNVYEHPENTDYQNALNTYYQKRDSLYMVKERRD